VERRSEHGPYGVAVIAKETSCRERGYLELESSGVDSGQRKQVGKARTG